MTSPEPVEPGRDDVLGRRIGAALIDLLLLSVLFVLFSVVFGQSSAEGGRASANLSGVPLLLFLLAAFLYYFALEAGRGQTVGKALLDVRVVREDGSRPGAGAIAGRTALRLVDGFFFYLVGFVTILATGRKQARLGDLAAGTRVVRS